MNIGLPELIIIFVVILLLFGAKSLPAAGKNLGKAVKSFRKEAKEIKKAVDHGPDKPKKP